MRALWISPARRGTASMGGAKKAPFIPWHQGKSLPHLGAFSNDFLPGSAGQSHLEIAAMDENTQNILLGREPTALAAESG